MDGADAARRLADHLTPSQGRLLASHWDRLPRRRAAVSLLERWAEGPGLPRGEIPFLHLLYLATSSESLFLGLLRRPAEWAGLSARVTRTEGLGREDLEEALARFFLLQRGVEPAAVLSAFRTLETARILLQDVLGILDAEEVTRELSALADVLVSRSFSLTFQPLRETLGQPLFAGPDGRAVPCPLAVFALGKLGGRELNYSSDVDLVGFYRAEGETDRGRPNGAFFNAWFQSAVALLSTPTPDGPCLRVDTALRPRGRDGELTLSFDAALSYYREWADLWERQAWIKARTCAGDEDAGALFLRRMEAVVYQEYSFAGIAQNNRRMRAKSLEELHRAGRSEGERNIKEGPGGIRDGEFAIQALQLAHGQRDPWVREGQTLLAATKLQQKGLLSPGRRSELGAAYLLLRRAEHWAQVQDMRQTHLLPARPEDWDDLARFLRLPDGAAARRAVEEARQSLAALFSRTVEELREGQPEGDEVARLLSPEGMREVLAAGGLADPDRALPYLTAIYEALGPNLGGSQRRQHFLRIHYSLEREFRRAPDAHRGLVSLSRFIGSLAAEPGLVALLLDLPRTPRLAFRLLSRSAPMEDALSRWPDLIEDLTFEKMRGVEAEILDLGGVPGNGPDALRRTQKRLFFLARAREILMGDGVEWSRRVHSRIAEGLTARVFETALRRTEGSEGLPPGTLDGRFALLALGRLGCREMQPRSDLDLVCLKAGPWALPDDPDRSARVESRLLGALSDGFTAVTRHGSLYDVDWRLRPYGDSGPPVTAPEALRSYFEGPARLWERLSYLKARPVAGNADLGWRTLEEVWRFVMDRGASEEEVEDLRGVLRRLGASATDLEGALKFWEGGLWSADLLAGLASLRARRLPVRGGGWTPFEGLSADLGRARAFQDALLHRVRIHLERPPSLPRLRQGLSDLRVLWGASALSLEGGLPPDDLHSHWERTRQVVLNAWKIFLPYRPVGGGRCPSMGADEA
jgi:glutamate-ammonia-ligase adenylyltransferase